MGTPVLSPNSYGITLAVSQSGSSLRANEETPVHFTAVVRRPHDLWLCWASIGIILGWRPRFFRGAAQLYHTGLSEGLNGAQRPAVPRGLPGVVLGRFGSRSADVTGLLRG